ncbi:MAG: hypothetical protein COT71_02255 [Candidatus Andersenbacteria bacterium CG10_big_fil_rev_8_21_14_0_10_54_11]|uniref:Uncharacterized protein n=1 Tax=Candidatus Andersenbacteria bacterium CG10_big_fil_rev_8_21_14_0_10_54_11 TaxID=1974485 RepID=A0A2M6WZD2_9BACT|nr:MAG: hypothetical protein COT71_02255 [Candidatus Andersenbacteria bacterium CG10_big_fil_rev_8_21_14_0_10_54_11]
MKGQSARQKVMRLDAQVQAIKQLFIGKPDPKEDQRVWQKTKKDIKNARAQVFRRRYGKG